MLKALNAYAENLQTLPSRGTTTAAWSYKDEVLLSFLLALLWEDVERIPLFRDFLVLVQ
jgi:hypothetical protein